MTKKFKIRAAEVDARRASWLLHLSAAASFIVFVLSLLFFPSSSESEIYTWKDSNGNVIFSDSPPTGSNAEEVRLKSDNRFERPPSREGAEPKAGKRNKEAAGQRLRDVRDINVVMYMTDW